MVSYCMTKASALAFHEGLSAELRSKTHGFNAPEIKLTCVHPTWAATPMIAPHRSTIDRSGMAVIEPQVVADAVIKQVLSGRGRQILLAPGVELIATVRAWPSWISGGLGAVAGKTYFAISEFWRGDLLILACVQRCWNVNVGATSLSLDIATSSGMLSVGAAFGRDLAVPWFMPYDVVALQSDRTSASWSRGGSNSCHDCRWTLVPYIKAYSSRHGVFLCADEITIECDGTALSRNDTSEISSKHHSALRTDQYVSSHRNQFQNS
jgi:hypothetical protein